MVEYNKWIETELKNIPFYQYNLENGDMLIYSVNGYGFIDLFCIYIDGSKYYHKDEELHILNILYISSGDNIEMIRSIMNLTYKEMLNGDYSYLGRMID